MTALGVRLGSSRPKSSGCQAVLQLETCISAIVPNTLTHLCLSPTPTSLCVYVYERACTSKLPTVAFILISLGSSQSHKEQASLRGDLATESLRNQHIWKPSAARRNRGWTWVIGPFLCSLCKMAAMNEERKTRC